MWRRKELSGNLPGNAVIIRLSPSLSLLCVVATTLVFFFILYTIQRLFILWLHPPLLVCDCTSAFQCVYVVCVAVAISLAVLEMMKDHRTGLSWHDCVHVHTHTTLFTYTEKERERESRWLYVSRRAAAPAFQCTKKVKKKRKTTYLGGIPVFFGRKGIIFLLKRRKKTLQQRWEWRGGEQCHLAFGGRTCNLIIISRCV